MTIKAIITSCGYVETGRIASNLWCPYIDSEEMTVEDAMKKLAFDMLRTYEDSSIFDYYSEDDFMNYIVSLCYGELHECNWIEDEKTTFTPYNKPTELFYIEKLETIYIGENFEKILLSFIDEEMIKLVFGSDIKYDIDEFCYTNFKCLKYKQEDYYQIEFDYDMWYNK